MSLPAATKDTSEHPSKTAVAAPVDKANKEADIDRKASSPFHEYSIDTLTDMLL